MSITTYAELQTAVKNWTHRANILGADDAADMIPDLILLGENRIFTDLRHRHMESAFSSTIAAGVIALPASYVELEYAYIDGTPVSFLERRTPEWIYSKYPVRSSDGKPCYIAREITNFIFGPFPDSGYTVKGVYYKRLSRISSATNALFDEFPELYLFAALSEAHVFTESEPPLLQVWEQKYQGIAGRIMAEHRKEKASGSAPVIRAV